MPLIGLVNHPANWYPGLVGNGKLPYSSLVETILDTGIPSVFSPPFKSNVTFTLYLILSPMLKSSSSSEYVLPPMFPLTTLQFVATVVSDLIFEPFALGTDNPTTSVAANKINSQVIPCFKLKLIKTPPIKINI